VARGRLNRLAALLETRSEYEHRSMVGSRVEVMVDSLDVDDVVEGAVAVGRTAGQAPEVDGVTYVEGYLPEGTKPGDVIEVTVSATVGYDFFGTC